MSFSKDTLGPRVRRVAEQLGYKAMGGGWIGKPRRQDNLNVEPTIVIGQGWLFTLGRKVADKLTQKYTAFGSMQDMMDAKDYRPTIMPYGSAAQRADMKLLADLYDHYQDRRGDARRAYRGRA